MCTFLPFSSSSVEPSFSALHISRIETCVVYFLCLGVFRCVHVAQRQRYRFPQEHIDSSHCRLPVDDLYSTMSFLLACFLLRCVSAPACSISATVRRHLRSVKTRLQGYNFPSAYLLLINPSLFLCRQPAPVVSGWFLLQLREVRGWRLQLTGSLWSGIRVNPSIKGKCLDNMCA